MQCPPTRPGRNGRKFHFVPAASQHLLGVDAEAMEDQRQLVDESNVHVALRVLDDLRRFGDANARSLVRAGLDDRGVQRIDEVGHLRRRAGGDLLDRREPMLLVAGIDALGAVAGEEITVEFQAREALEDRDGDLLGAAGIHGRLEHDDVALLQHLAQQLARALDRLQVRSLVVVDRRGHRDDEDPAGAQILELGRVAEVLRRLELVAVTSRVLSRPFLSSATRDALMSKPTVLKLLPNSTASGRPT